MPDLHQVPSMILDELGTHHRIRRIGKDGSIWGIAIDNGERESYMTFSVADSTILVRYLRPFGSPTRRVEATFDLVDPCSIDKLSIFIEQFLIQDRHAAT
jgi:hypothetical protein